MTFMIVSHTHNYDLVANKKLIHHIKKRIELNFISIFLFLICFFFFVVFFSLVYSLLLQNCPKQRY